MFFSKAYRKLLRKHMNSVNIGRLENNGFSVISSNCVGGVMVSELEQRFNSPTVNLFFYPHDYIKFCSDLKYYLSCTVQKERERPYPIGRIDDIRIMFMHYPNFETAKRKWEERCKRVNFENLFFIMAERDGCTQFDIEAFDQLSYKNKVVFTSCDHPQIKSAYHIPNTESPGGGYYRPVSVQGKDDW